MRRFSPLALGYLAAWGAAFAAGPYLGSEACARCHQREYDRQIKSRHARALRPILGSPLADALIGGGSADSGVQYAARANGIAVTARRDGEALSGVLEWAFGAGAQGMTPVGRSGEAFFEHRFSYYPAAGRLGLTFGHPLRAQTPGAMLGVPQSAHAVTTCFQCHSTAVEETGHGPDLSAIQLGVRCERCHGPGRQHVELATAGRPVAELRQSILNPGRFPAKAQVAICGQCHRLPSPGDSSPEPEVEDPVALRFAPVGLMASRCFIQSKRLACTTCHDPHEDARPRTDAFYTTRCVGCHASAPKAGSSCPRASQGNCLECHMRQAPLSAYLKFTDHRIRIY